MDFTFTPDFDVKKENEDFDFLVRVKVDKDIEWPIHMVAGPNEENQDDGIIYAASEGNNLPTINSTPIESHQDKVNDPYKNFQKHSFQTCVQENYIFCSESLQTVKSENIDIIKYEESEDVYQCYVCKEYFSESNSLYQHNLIHLEVPLMKIKLYMCGHCPKYYKKKRYLRYHILINHVKNYNSQIPISKQSHKCLFCRKTYSYNHWFSHMREVHSPKKYKCKKCNSWYKNERTLKRHNAHIHNRVTDQSKKNQQKTECPKCPAILNSKYALTTHIRNCHSNTYTCDICKSTLKSRSYYLAHKRRVHPTDGVKHQCDICGKEFKSERYVTIHIKGTHKLRHY